METLINQINQLRQGWDKTRQTLLSNPSWWSNYASSLSIEQLDEVIGSLGELASRIKIPLGFRPNFHIANLIASNSIAQSITHLTSVRNGSHGQVANFLTTLNQALIALNSMLFFGGKQDARKVAIELTAELAQSLSLLDTAQNELSRKLTALAESEKIAENIKTGSEEIESHSIALEELLETAKSKSDELVQKTEEKLESLVVKTQAAMEDANNDFKDRSNSLKLQETEMAQKTTELKTLFEECIKLKSTLSDQLKKNESVQANSENQQKLIEALLPKGASAGLAAAFESRAAQMENTKLIWMVTFLVSIAGLIAIAAWLAHATTVSSSSDLWLQLAQRLPFAAPLIWLGWFSAIQYGNTIRVQEDYAFKAATSKAFAGYRDHMEHMASVKLEDANTAMLLLAQRTIEILAHEPLRLYGKPDGDVSPSNQLTKIFDKSKNKAEGDN